MTPQDMDQLDDATWAGCLDVMGAEAKRGIEAR